MREKENRLLVLSGPTASGKTALGVALALQLDGEVVGADSMQIYRGMDIGTAKPTSAEMQGVPHHMLDVADPAENYSAARYATTASACVEEIFAKGKIPVVVGGTGLYIDALVRGTEYAAAPGDSGLRERLEREYEALGGEEFRKKLAKTDPERAEKLHPGDKKRLVRAMEVYCLTGETITSHDERSKKMPSRYETFRVALDFRDRETLYRRIDIRAKQMFSAGLTEEVRALLEGGVPKNCTAMQAIGYKEVADFLEGKLSEAEAMELVQRRSRQYAKRQLTWLRGKKDTRWIFWEDAPDLSVAKILAEEFRCFCAEGR